MNHHINLEGLMRADRSPSQEFLPVTDLDLSKNRRNDIQPVGFLDCWILDISQFSRNPVVHISQCSWDGENWQNFTTGKIGKKHNQMPLRCPKMWKCPSFFHGFVQRVFNIRGNRVYMAIWLFYIYNIVVIFDDDGISLSYEYPESEVSIRFSQSQLLATSSALMFVGQNLII